MKARVTVTLKSGILDPQGKAIEGALRSLGVRGVASVRQGKVFDIEIEGADRAGAEAALKTAAEKLLANTVIENYRVEVTRHERKARQRDCDEIRGARFSRHQSRARHGAGAAADLRARAGDGLARRDAELPPGTELVVIPGGFSYGDYLRCGAIAARAPIMDAVRAFAAKGGLVLAICNGFQIACEAGLLPGVLMRNAQLRFICRDVYLRVERSDTPFTRGYNAGQVIRVPVAHGEGNYIADGETIARLEGEGRVVFRYSSPDGMVDPDWNHNGAINAIAGIVNARGNVLGMMPHPENHVEAVDGPHRRPRPVRGAGGSFQAGGVTVAIPACPASTTFRTN